MSVRATVQNGRLIVDQETQLPEGTVLDLVIDDEGDDLDDAQRRALDQAITNSLHEAETGQMRPALEILARLHARRRK